MSNTLQIIHGQNNKIVEVRKRKSFNGHGHTRKDALMRTVAPLAVLRYFAVVVMPNPKGFFITSYDRMVEYRRMHEEISDKVNWLIKCYMTDTMEPREAERMCELPYFAGAKYYPANATTNSEDGISDPSLLWTPGTKPFECMRVFTQARKPISYHGADVFARTKVTIGRRTYNPADDNNELDLWDQEPHFLRQTYPRIIGPHPDAIHVLEHLTTIDGIEFARRNTSSGHLYYTVTAHHPMIDRRDMMRGGMRPILYCLPVPQSFEHTQELRTFTTEGRDDVFAGPDDAPHPKALKYSGCCAAGVNTAGCSEEIYTELFDQMNALHNLEKFTSLVGPRVYGIEPSNEITKLVRSPWSPAPMFTCDDGTEILGFEMPDKKSGTRVLQWQIVS